jgi:Dip2/Utp12 Family
MTMKFAVSSQWLAQTAASSPSSSSSSQQITIRDATHGRLQCTLRSQPGRPIRRLTLHGTVLVGEAHAAADTTTTSDDDAATTMVWDLTRGVMAYELTGAGIRSACCAAAVGTTMTTGATNPQQHQVYVLKQKDNTDKLIVYEYNSAGAVVRKVKAGKTSSTGDKLQLFVTNDLFVVVQHEETAGTLSWRMIDLIAGSKRAKASTGYVQQLIVASTQHAHSGNTNHHGYAFGIITSSANHHHKTLFCLNLSTGNVVELPSNLTSQNVQDLQVAERRDGGGFYLLLNNSQLYILARDEEVDGDDDDALIAATASLYCTLPTDKDNVVHILHSDRLMVVDGHSGTVQRVYLDWATLPQEVAAIATTDEDAVMNDADEEPIGKDKRKSGSSSSNNDKVAVLGPGQAGSMSKADVEHPVNKKARSSNTKSSVVSISESSSTDPNTAAVMVDELTMAERLRQLEQAADELESSEDDTNNMEKQHKDLSSTTAAVITTESLYQLIAQGLQSNDRNLVETALRVADSTVIRATCRELNASQTQQLLYWLTDRIAARPNRGERLAAWLSCLIPTVASADDLKPLHNLLQDRLQVYPRLMHLQGRLQYLENSDEGQ